MLLTAPPRGRPRAPRPSARTRPNILSRWISILPAMPVRLGPAASRRNELFKLLRFATAVLHPQPSFLALNPSACRAEVSRSHEIRNLFRFSLATVRSVSLKDSHTPDEIVSGAEIQRLAPIAWVLMSCENNQHRLIPFGGNLIMRTSIAIVLFSASLIICQTVILRDYPIVSCHQAHLKIL